MQEKFLLLSERSKRDILDNLPEEEDFYRLADYFSNFSDGTRIKILSCLSLSRMCVSDLSRILNINQTTISHQLKTLKDKDLVSFRREGKILVYELKGKGVNEIFYYASQNV